MSQVPFKNVYRTLEKLIEEGEHLLPRKSKEESIKARKDGNVLYISKNHNKKVHETTLCFYNQSVAFAEENSEELALGYGNRSALLLHLKKYKECLIDIDRACKITKSEELKKKLAARKKDCWIRIDGKEEEDDVVPPKYEFKPSTKIPCGSNLVTIQYDKKYGRHIVATEDIQPGTVVFVEKGVLLSPEMNRIHLNCSHCLNLAWNGIPCSGCTSAVYCSKKCKEEAWQEYHDIECLILPYFDYLTNVYGYTKNEIPFIRLFIKAVKAEGLTKLVELHRRRPDVLDVNSFGGFFHNLIHYNKLMLIFNLAMSNQNLSESNALCSLIVFLINKKTKILDGFKNNIPINRLIIVEILKQLRHIIDSNAFSFQTFGTSYEERKNNMYGTMSGVILAPFSSFFNHSCVNNVERLFTQNHELLLYSSNFIKKGQQLFVNYGSNDTMNLEERLSYLKTHYDFVCDCPACTEDWPSATLTKVDFDEQDSSKIYSELMKNQLMSTFFLINKCTDKWQSTDYSIEEAIKIMSIVHKYYSGFKAYKHTYTCVDFIIFYFEKHYGLKINIPNDC